MLLKQKIPKSVVIVGVPEKCASGTTPPNASVYNVGRNKTFAFLMEAIYSLDCDVIYITHETDEYMNDTAVGKIPAWKDWGGKLEQEIRCWSTTKKQELKFHAQLIASRTNGDLVGKIWITRDGKAPDVVWHGIPELREGNI